MWASWRTWAPLNQAAVRPFTERTKRSSPWRTTQTVTGVRREPSCRSGAICSSSAAPILLSSSLVHAIVAAIGTPPSVMFEDIVLRVMVGLVRCGALLLLLSLLLRPASLCGATTAPGSSAPDRSHAGWAGRRHSRPD